MDVFLLPVDSRRYELYCEVPDESPDVDAEIPRGFFRRLRHRFSAMLADAERQRGREDPDQTPRSLAGRLQARTMRWVAESIAEQRLLWHLRSQVSASLVRPDDIDQAQATGILRKQLSRDSERHRFWLIVDSVAFVVTGPLLFAIPGPNVVAYYFAFRAVGHYLSRRGARQGLGVVEWRHESSAPLSALRRAIDLEPEARERCVQDVAAELRLEHLPKFFARTAIPAP